MINYKSDNQKMRNWKTKESFFKVNQFIKMILVDFDGENLINI